MTFHRVFNRSLQYFFFLFFLTFPFPSQWKCENDHRTREYYLIAARLSRPMMKPTTIINTTRSIESCRISGSFQFWTEWGESRRVTSISSWSCMCVYAWQRKQRAAVEGNYFCGYHLAPPKILLNGRVNGRGGREREAFTCEETVSRGI